MLDFRQRLKPACGDDRQIGKVSVDATVGELGVSRQEEANLILD